MCADCGKIIRCLALFLVLASPASAQSITYWVIDNAGLITLTPAGAAHFAGLAYSETYNLQISATNASGTGMGTATVIVNPQGGYLLACCPGDSGFLLTDLNDKLLAQ